MASSHKKVIVRKMGRDSISGYVSPANFAVEGKLELLNPSGKVVLIDLGEVKSVDFVRDFSAKVHYRNGGGGRLRHGIQKESGLMPHGFHTTRSAI